MTRKSDFLIIGSGLYGLHAAKLLESKGKKSYIVSDRDPFKLDENNNGSASIVNQARLHNGYHYPRSFNTASRSSKYFNMFLDEFKDAIINDFEQYYGVSKRNSLTSSEQFEKFAEKVGIPLNKSTLDFVNYDNIEETYLAKEYAIDTKKMLKIARQSTKAKTIISKVANAEFRDNLWTVTLENGDIIKANFIINASYSGLNEITDVLNVTPLKLKYEVSEELLLKVPKDFHKAITVMDGPFFSLMPYDEDNWSLTHVLYTHHFISNDIKEAKQYIDNTEKNSNAKYILKSIEKFLSKEFIEKISYEKSIWTIKTLNDNAELDDNRLVSTFYENNVLSILGGKLDTIYDSDESILKLLD